MLPAVASAGACGDDEWVCGHGRLCGDGKLRPRGPIWTRLGSRQAQTRPPVHVEFTSYHESQGHRREDCGCAGETGHGVLAKRGVGESDRALNPLCVCVLGGRGGERGLSGEVWCGEVALGIDFCP